MMLLAVHLKRRNKDMASVFKIEGCNVQIKLLDSNAKIPTRGSEYAAGYDLYADLDADTDSITVHPHNTVKINTGISIALPYSTFGAIFARSGLATKQGLRPANCVGK
jgi:dUTP pyrophosphatase